MNGAGRPEMEAGHESKGSAADQRNLRISELCFFAFLLFPPLSARAQSVVGRLPTGAAPRAVAVNPVTKLTPIRRLDHCGSVWQPQRRMGVDDMEGRIVGFLFLWQLS
jgi:hypothetical protein